MGLPSPAYHDQVAIRALRALFDKAPSSRKTKWEDFVRNLDKATGDESACIRAVDHLITLTSSSARRSRGIARGSGSGASYRARYSDNLRALLAARATAAEPTGWGETRESTSLERRRARDDHASRRLPSIGGTGIDRDRFLDYTRREAAREAAREDYAGETPAFTPFPPFVVSDEALDSANASYLNIFSPTRPEGIDDIPDLAPVLPVSLFVDEPFSPPPRTTSMNEADPDLQRLLEESESHQARTLLAAEGVGVPLLLDTPSEGTLEAPSNGNAVASTLSSTSSSTAPAAPPESTSAEVERLVAASRASQRASALASPWLSALPPRRLEMEPDPLVSPTVSHERRTWSPGPVDYADFPNIYVGGSASTADVEATVQAGTDAQRRRSRLLRDTTVASVPGSSDDEATFNPAHRSRPYSLAPLRDPRRQNAYLPAAPGLLSTSRRPESVSAYMHAVARSERRDLRNRLSGMADGASTASTSASTSAAVEGADHAAWRHAPSRRQVLPESLSQWWERTQNTGAGEGSSGPPPNLRAPLPVRIGSATATMDANGNSTLGLEAGEQEQEPEPQGLSVFEAFTASRRERERERRRRAEDLEAESEDAAGARSPRTSQPSFAVDLLTFLDETAERREAPFVDFSGPEPVPLHRLGSPTDSIASTVVAPLVRRARMEPYARTYSDWGEMPEETRNELQQVVLDERERERERFAGR